MMPPRTPPTPASTAGWSSPRPQVGGDGLGQHGDRHALEPDVARPGQGHQVVAVTAEGDVLDAREPGDGEAHPVLEQPDVTGVHQQRLPGGQFVGGDLARQLDPGPALALEPLEDEPVPAVQTAPERLLQARRWARSRRSRTPSRAGGPGSPGPAAMAISKIRPGSLAPKATMPWPPWASYLVRKRPPPPTARFRPLMIPFWPPVEVVWVSCTLVDIQDSSPWVEITDSPGSSSISSSGMVVPLTSACMSISSSRRAGGAGVVRSSQSAPNGARPGQAFRRRDGPIPGTAVARPGRSRSVDRPDALVA